MDVYCEMINLERDCERREQMKAEMARAGVSAEFFPAIDFQEAGEEHLLVHCRKEGPWGVFQLPDMACTLSHAEAWGRFLETEATHCLILEDDVFISPELGAWIDDLGWWPKDADIVKLERWRARSLRVLLQRSGPRHLNRSLRRMFSRHVGAAGYILTRKAAKTLLADRPFDITVDNLLFNANASKSARGMTIYQVQPALIEQGNEPEGTRPGGAWKSRPQGLPLLRQKIRRGYHEVSFPISTILKFLAGQLTAAQVTFVPNALNAADHRPDIPGEASA